ncbi:MAG: hypothetical protein WCD38_11745 [Candidatus Tumulicola sp.]
MYNAVFGQNMNAAEILKSLGLTESDFYRYRDTFVNDDGKIAVYTRGGGDNHNCWNDERCSGDTHGANCVVPMQEKIRNHPLYHHEADDDFDRTYCTVYFRAPSEAVLALRNNETRGEKAWPKFFEEMQRK